MQLHAVRVAITHFSDFLPFAHRLVFLDEQGLVVRVGRQKGVVVLENNQVAVATQPGACIHHTAIG